MYSSVTILTEHSPETPAASRFSSPRAVSTPLQQSKNRQQVETSDSWLKHPQSRRRYFCVADRLTMESKDKSTF